jgi:hypothetical protein
MNSKNKKGSRLDNQQAFFVYDIEKSYQNNGITNCPTAS